MCTYSLLSYIFSSLELLFPRCQNIQLHLYFSKLIRVLKISKKTYTEDKEEYSGLLLRCFRKHTFVVLQMLVLKSERIRGHKKGIERAKSLGLITCLFCERVGY